MVNDLEPVTIEQIQRVKRKIWELKHISTMRYEYQILEDQLAQMLKNYDEWREKERKNDKRNLKQIINKIHNHKKKLEKKILFLCHEPLSKNMLKNKF